MLEDEQFELEASARDVLDPWRKKIAPFLSVQCQSYLAERDRESDAIALRISIRCGVKIQKTEFDRMLGRIIDMAEWRWNPPDHLASGW